MTRLLLRASVVALVAGLALTQLEASHHLLAWELILLGAGIWELRQLPTGRVRADPPLFGSKWSEPARLPRAVSTTEWMVMDALSGRVAADRRLQPALERIALHRLQQKGIDLQSPRGMAQLGDREWEWLTTPAKEPPDLEVLRSVVERLEET